MSQPPEMLERNVDADATVPEQPPEPATESRRILIIESGSPGITRRALPHIQRNFTNPLCDLCTCWPDSDPSDFETVFRTSEDRGSLDKLRRVWSFRKRRYQVLVLICSGEPVMKLWCALALLFLPAKKMIVNENADFSWLDWKNRHALALLFLPAKKMIVNENADFSWLDWKNRHAVWQFLGTRWSGVRTELLLTVVRLLVLPFTLILLVCTSLFYYTRRWRRLLLWRLQAKPSPGGRPSSSTTP